MNILDNFKFLMFNFKIISKNLISQTETFLFSGVLFKKLKHYLKITKFKIKNSYHPAFTLIELLVVIVIIGVLATLATVAVSSARTKARDAKRISDMKQISTALEMYYADYTAYPNIITPGQPLISDDGTKTYMAKVPNNPTPRAEGACADLDYQYSAGNDNYSLIGCLSKAVGDVPAGARKIEKSGTPRDLGPTNGLVGWWMLDGLNGTKNLTGLTSPGSFGGTGVVTSTGRYNEVDGAYSFNGLTTSYINVGNSNIIHPASGITVSGWIKLNVINAAKNTIINKGTESSQTDYWLTLWNNSGHKVVFEFGCGSTYFTHFSSAFTPLTGRWYHLAGTYDSVTENSQVYLDAVPGTLTNRSGCGELGSNINNALIGKYMEYAYAIDGYIADVRVYNRALSDAEVSALYEATKP